MTEDTPSVPSKERLSEIRVALDSIDRQIVSALAQRHRLVGEVARFKDASGRDLRDMLREEQILTNLVDLGRQEGLDANFVTRMFREILSYSLRSQQEYIVDQQNPDREAVRVRVCYQGTDGSYSHLAAGRYFEARDVEADFRGYNTFKQILEAVRDGDADYAVLPIENTTAGSINDSYDLLAEMDLHLVGEEVQRVDHCLVAVEDVPVHLIRRVFSHPQALAQCSRFLTRLDQCHVESFTDTAMAVKKIRAEKDLSQAAIASEEAARLYGLHIIKRDIANQKENFTRFVIVANEPVHVDDRIPCKTSTVFGTRHEHGALLSCLNILAGHGLNLTKLESRPRPHTPWQYLFYVDFEGNITSPVVEEALTQLKSATAFLKVLGSYPARTTTEAQPATPKRRPTGSLRAVLPPPLDVEPDVVQALERKPYRLVSRTQRPQDTVVVVGEVHIGSEHPIVIAGPSAIESREQIMACAKAVKDLGGDILQGGSFFPRATPGSFQGLGFEGLEYLEEAGRAFGLPVCTPVLHPSDVERVATHADLLIISARNMENFELLKAVGRVKRPVVLKRGRMASIDEWLEAAELIMSQGNQQVVLCERGIRTFESATQSTLDLSAVPIVRERSHLPILVDPTHALGAWRFIAPMTLSALAAGAQGVILEVHPSPKEALSDGPQSLSFEHFGGLMGQVHAWFHN